MTDEQRPDSTCLRAPLSFINNLFFIHISVHAILGAEAWRKAFTWTSLSFCFMVFGFVCWAVMVALPDGWDGCEPTRFMHWSLTLHQQEFQTLIVGFCLLATYGCGHIHTAYRIVSGHSRESSIPSCHAICAAHHARSVLTGVVYDILRSWFSDLTDTATSSDCHANLLAPTACSLTVSQPLQELGQTDSTLSCDEPDQTKISSRYVGVGPVRSSTYLPPARQSPNAMLLQLAESARTVGHGAAGVAWLPELCPASAFLRELLGPFLVSSSRLMESAVRWQAPARAARFMAA